MLRHSDATWSNPKVLSTLGVVFLCGAALGCALTRSYLHAWRPVPVAIPVTVERVRHDGVSNLRERLLLTPEQEKKITEILDEYGKFYQNIDNERQDVAEAGRRSILEVLTPEQRAKFNQLFATRKQ